MVPRGWGSGRSGEVPVVSRPLSWIEKGLGHQIEAECLGRCEFSDGFVLMMVGVDQFD